MLIPNPDKLGTEKVSRKGAKTRRFLKKFIALFFLRALRLCVSKKLNPHSCFCDLHDFRGGQFPVPDLTKAC